MEPLRRISTYERSRSLQQRAHDLIPAGCHTYSRGDDQFPSRAPSFIQRGKGCYCWDVDGNQFLDWGMGLRTGILGHAYPRVLDAVQAQLELGSNFTRASTLELDLAELLIDLIPSAEMVKFAKNGSDVTSAAVRLARAYTGRDYVAYCRDHPFFSVGDWFIGSTPVNAGIPKQVQELTLQFSYNDPESLRTLFEEYPGKIAAIILEPATVDPPSDGFLQQVRELTRTHGAIMIFDEIITGFRWHLRGAQTYFGVTPDLSTFGKAIGNGFSVSALVGRRDIMELGGLQHNKERVFLLSTTHGGETHGLAAAIATISEIKAQDVTGHIWRVGKLLQDSFNQLAQEMGLGEAVAMTGYPCSPYLICRDQDGNLSAKFRTLLLQELIAYGVLAPWLAPSFCHGEPEVELTTRAARQAFEVYRIALNEGSVSGFLEGPAVKPVFRRYN